VAPNGSKAFFYVKIFCSNTAKIYFLFSDLQLTSSADARIAVVIINVFIMDVIKFT
jgi:hypothetical protein